MKPQNGSRRATKLRRMTLPDRGAEQPPALTAAQHRAVAITAIDGREHLVAQFALAERWRDDGWYPAWCGTWVAGASMCEPPGRPCDLCACMSQVTRKQARDAPPGYKPGRMRHQSARPS
jgi:hypothetical protein